MTQKKVYELTQDGIDKLKIELESLIDVERPKNLSMLKEAREQGDLSENADYDAARNEQSRIETRITEIENILKNSKIIKISNKDIVEIGKTVELKNITLNKNYFYHLVGTLEANPIQNKISVDSPLGKAIVGFNKGDVVTYRSDTGKQFQVEILDIKNESL